MPTFGQMSAQGSSMDGVGVPALVCHLSGRLVQRVHLVARDATMTVRVDRRLVGARSSSESNLWSTIELRRPRPLSARRGTWMRLVPASQLCGRSAPSFVTLTTGGSYRNPDRPLQSSSGTPRV
jgi:hypothetical protein